MFLNAELTSTDALKSGLESGAVFVWADAVRVEAAIVKAIARVEIVVFMMQRKKRLKVFLFSAL